MKIICYSCGRGEYPENTIEGIKHCQRINPEWRIEMDIQITLDEELVLFHDYNTLRTTGSEGLINKLKVKDVFNLNAGHNFIKEGELIYRSKPIKVPALSEVFETFPRAKLLLDIHTDNIKAVQILTDLITSKFKSGDFIIVSEYDQIIKEFRKKKPNWKYGVPEKEAKKMLYSSFLCLDRFFPIKSNILMLPKQYGKINVLTKRVMAHAKKRKKEIWAWMYEGESVKTVDSLEEIQELQKLGVQGIFTEFPEKIYNEINVS